MSKPSKKKRKKSEQQSVNGNTETAVEKIRLKSMECEIGQGDNNKRTSVHIKSPAHTKDTERSSQKSRKTKAKRPSVAAESQEHITLSKSHANGRSNRESTRMKGKVSDTDGSITGFDTPGVGLDDSTRLKKRRKKSKSISNGIKQNEDGEPASNSIERPRSDDTVKAQRASESLQQQQNQEEGKAILLSEDSLRSDSQNQAASPITTDEPSEHELSKNNGVSKVGTSKHKRKSKGFCQQDKEDEDEFDGGVENLKESSLKEIEDDCEVQNREAKESQNIGNSADDNAKISEEKQSENMEQKEKKKKKRASLPVLPWMRHPIEIDPDAKQPLEVMHTMHSCLRDALIKSEILYLLLSPSRCPF